MAFTYCTNCGEKIDMSEARCPHCGYMRAQSSAYAPEMHTERPDAGEYNGGAPYGRSPYGQGQEPYGQGSPYGQSPYGQGGHSPYSGNPMYRVPMHRQKRPISVGLLIFSIVNIVLGLVLTTPSIFGIMALVYTVGAQNAASEAEAVAKKKTALIINIVGAVMGVLSAISFFMIFAKALEQLMRR